jgi:hypothetical protein
MKIPAQEAPDLAEAPHAVFANYVSATGIQLLAEAKCALATSRTSTHIKLRFGIPNQRSSFQHLIQKEETS